MAVDRIPFHILDELMAHADDPVQPVTVQIEAQVAGPLDDSRVHAAVLDSIAVHPREERSYHGEIDAQQMAWLADTLESAGADMPIIVSTHIPILTAFWSILRGNEEPPPSSVVTANAKDVIDLLHPYNVKAVLQGHTHVREIIDYHGCKYITSGAVCGDWWKGLRLGHPEGYALISLKDGEVHWKYQTYGFEAVAEG